MRADLNDILKKCPRQHSLDWFRARIGRFTGSQVGRLMKSGRGKDDYFSKDALTYIAEIASERLLNPSVLIDDDLFEDYLAQTTTSNKHTAWGNDQEPNAKDLYCSINRRNVTSCGCLEWSQWWFADSPDGLAIEDNGCIEIKSPLQKTHTEYMLNVSDAESLKAYKPEYYWQVMAHLTVTGADWCDWMSYCPFSQKPLHVVRINRNDDDIALMLERVNRANELATEMVTKVRTLKPAECHK